MSGVWIMGVRFNSAGPVKIRSGQWIPKGYWNVAAWDFLNLTW